MALVACFFEKFAKGYLPRGCSRDGSFRILVVIVSTGLSLDRAQEHIENTQRKTLRDCLLHSEQFPAHVFLRQVQQRNGVLMSAATGQRVRPQLSVCNRAVSSTLACHDHDVCMPSNRRLCSAWWFSDSRMDMMIIGFLTKVFPQAPVVVGIIELSAVRQSHIPG